MKGLKAKQLREQYCDGLGVSDLEGLGIQPIDTTLRHPPGLKVVTRRIYMPPSGPMYRVCLRYSKKGNIAAVHPEHTKNVLMYTTNSI